MEVVQEPNSWDAPAHPKRSILRVISSTVYPPQTALHLHRPPPALSPATTFFRAYDFASTKPVCQVVLAAAALRAASNFLASFHPPPPAAMISVSPFSSIFTFFSRYATKGTTLTR